MHQKSPRFPLPSIQSDSNQMKFQRSSRRNLHKRDLKHSHAPWHSWLHQPSPSRQILHSLLPPSVSEVRMAALDAWAAKPSRQVAFELCRPRKRPPHSSIYRSPPWRVLASSHSCCVCCCVTFSPVTLFKILLHWICTDSFPFLCCLDCGSTRLNILLNFKGSLLLFAF